MKYLLPTIATMVLLLASCQDEDGDSDKQQDSEQNTDQFADLAEDDSFKQAHRLPGDFKLEDGRGSMINYPVRDGQAANAYYVESEVEGSNTYLFVFHEWYGLNEYVKKESEKLAQEFPNAHVLALDLYDGKVATTRDDAQKYMEAVDNERALAIIEGASEYAGGDARIGTIGWCFGGGWSLQAALKLGAKAKACVMYYGMPVMEVEKLKTLDAPVLGHFAAQDDWITPEKVAQFEQAMKKAGKSVKTHSYDAKHAFANPTRDIYQPQAAEEAWGRTVTFFEKHLIEQ